MENSLDFIFIDLILLRSLTILLTFWLMAITVGLSIQIMVRILEEDTQLECTQGQLLFCKEFMEMEKGIYLHGVQALPCCSWCREGYRNEAPMLILSVDNCKGKMCSFPSVLLQYVLSPPLKSKALYVVRGFSVICRIFKWKNKNKVCEICEPVTELRLWSFCEYR